MDREASAFKESGWTFIRYEEERIIQN
jgi:hypothetical protein